MSQAKRFMSKPKPCDTCEAREATEVRGFGGFMGWFFVCDGCTTPPTWAVRAKGRGLPE